MSETPAETIRRAATLMRERAKPLTGGFWPGRPWEASECEHGCPCVVFRGEDAPPEEPQIPPIEYVCDAETGEHAAHIASWHPLVALAVARWLDGAAEDARDAFQQPNGEWEMPHYGAVSSALTIARVYLGEAVG